MKKNLVLFDGNSKFFLGGGQIVTLNVLDLFKDDFNTHLIEVDPTDEFYRLSEKFTKNRIRISGLFTIFKILTYFKENKITKDNSVLYSATKLSHMYLIFFKFIGFKTIVHIHSVNSKKSFLFYVLKFAYLFPTKLIFPSLYVQNYLNLKRGELVYNSVKKICKDELGFSKRKIVYIGSVVDFKGVEDFCEVSQFYDGVFDFEVWGKGELAEILKSRYPKVAFIGFVNNVVEKLAEEAYLMILPTRIAEAFGLVIAESFSANVPVITTNIGAQFELVNLIQGTGGFSPGSIKELKQQIDIFSDDANYKKIKNNLKNWDNYFSETVFKEKFLKIFNS